MKTKVILGIFKIVLAGIIVFNCFGIVGQSRGVAIWLGFVVGIPLTLWGVLDFVKKNEEEKDE
jgi:hypothetical protein